MSISNSSFPKTNIYLLYPFLSTAATSLPVPISARDILPLSPDFGHLSCVAFASSEHILQAPRLSCVQSITVQQYRPQYHLSPHPLHLSLAMFLWFPLASLHCSSCFDKYHRLSSLDKRHSSPQSPTGYRV